MLNVGAFVVEIYDLLVNIKIFIIISRKKLKIIICLNLPNLLE